MGKYPSKEQIDLRQVAENCVASHEQYKLTEQSKLGVYSQAAIAVDSPKCASLGKNILELNGSVVDAAITTALCNGLFNAHSLGLGGGHFMLIYLKNKRKVIAIDSRETAPGLANETMFINRTFASYQGGLASGIPGEIAGYWLAHQKAGRLPWKTLIQPVIDLALNGINVSRPLATALLRTETAIFNDQVLKSIYVNSDTNKIVQENDTIKYTKLANTLRIIADKGADAFYQGELSQFIIQENNLNGGIFTLDDLKNFHAKERDAIKIQLSDNYTAYTLPPPAGGLLVTFIMQLMNSML
jgi:gamma-glutamyltranspeptidase / glutathione hydrolase / leukotriene-C4 hydrolase